MELEGTPKTQTKPPHIIDLLHEQNVHGRRPSPFSVTRNQLVHRNIDNLLLERELTHHNLEKNVSTIPNAGDGIFTTVAIPRGTVISYFYGYIMYLPRDEDITQENWNTTQQYHPRKSVSYGKFMNRAYPMNRLLKYDVKRKINRRRRKKVPLYHQFDSFIFSEYFCAARFINDARQGEEEADPHRYNVKIVKNQAQRKHEKYDFLLVKATRNIPANTELFLNYGNEYDFAAVHDADEVTNA